MKTTVGEDHKCSRYILHSYLFRVKNVSVGTGRLTRILVIHSEIIYRSHCFEGPVDNLSRQITVFINFNLAAPEFLVVEICCNKNLR